MCLQPNSAGCINRFSLFLAPSCILRKITPFHCMSKIYRFVARYSRRPWQENSTINHVSTTNSYCCVARSSRKDRRGR